MFYMLILQVLELHTFLPGTARSHLKETRPTRNPSLAFGASFPYCFSSKFGQVIIIAFTSFKLMTKSISDHEHSQSYASSKKNHRVDKRTYEQRKKTLQCDKPNCGQIVSSQSAMIKHMQRIHGASKATRTTTLDIPKTRMFVWNKKCQCPVRGC